MLQVQAAAMQGLQQKAEEAEAQVASAVAKASEAGKAGSQAQQQLQQLHEAYRSHRAVTWSQESVFASGAADVCYQRLCNILRSAIYLMLLIRPAVKH